MKTLLSILLAAGVAVGPALAGFKIPKSVYRYDKIADAMEEAEKEKKALAFVYTDEAST